ncbi:hypothetical protein SAMN06297387_121101 [Streptomyces zhaozhouensis]|uniref:Small hydrophobic protein n=1 Tax=Streptomyces zhaozhouensis TaxID=1300267 RepID=A0A286E367_9ACTN|nr:DUF6126 family protein [Streptomyces zhaozhouensis]SOD65342.1 hypothetical protein SAMN06297387_121101 [Streptomyces zhaozhouensis]
MAKTRRETRGEKIPRGLWIRVLLYGLVGHLFAAFLIFLFTVGE